MHYPGEYRDIENWIRVQAEDVQVLHIQKRDIGTFSGLMFLHVVPDATAVPTIHLGYFFRESCWGAGYATEAVGALVAAMRTGPAVYLNAGVDRSNAASARVLEKVGFERLERQPTADRDFFGLALP